MSGEPIPCGNEGCTYVAVPIEWVRAEHWNHRRHVAKCILATLAERAYRNVNTDGRWPPSFLRRMKGLPPATRGRPKKARAKAVVR